MSEPSVLSRLAALPTANIGDAMERLGILDSRIRPVWPGARVAGYAFTVWTRSGDNALIHQALEVVGAGDVIVVNGGGDESRALIGELIGQRAKNSGVAGFVIDGAVRDAEGLGEMGMPVFARAVTPAEPYKNGPGHLGRTIAVGGVAVAPGDLILGDADGVVVVPLAEAERVAQAAEAVFSLEEGKRAAILESE
ncbi:methyltransferase [Nonomuraea sp. NPDC052129]|uniref:RraA family protein n=1 Tax=Nonomuraea sp. NPDC052129 TaxID=3154651 RepID=UPI00341298C1